MRILAGKLKSRELKTPKGEKTRPTSGKVRGSVFDILQSQVDGAHFLDLFAGSGAMGIEALSRGAEHATFIENDRSALKALKENLSNLHLLEEATLIPKDAFVATSQLAKKGAQFEIIFIDPPYALDISSLLSHLPSLLAEGGILLIEQGKKGDLTIEGLEQTETRTFGDTILHFFQHE